MGEAVVRPSSPSAARGGASAKSEGTEEGKGAPLESKMLLKAKLMHRPTESCSSSQANLAMMDCGEPGPCSGSGWGETQANKEDGEGARGHGRGSGRA